MGNIIVMTITSVALFTYLHYLRKAVYTPATAAPDGSRHLKSPGANYVLLVFILLLSLALILLIFIVPERDSEARIPLGILALITLLLSGFIWAYIRKVRVYWNEKGIYAQGISRPLRFCPWEDIRGGKYLKLTSRIELSTRKGKFSYYWYMQGSWELLNEIMERRNLELYEFGFPKNFIKPPQP